jgi:hypothetical protein
MRHNSGSFLHLFAAGKYHIHLKILIAHMEKIESLDWNIHCLIILEFGKHM